MEQFAQFTVGFTSANYVLTDHDLVFRYGMRTKQVPLAQIRGFAVRVRPPFLKVPTSALVMRVDNGRRAKPLYLPIVPSSDGGRALIAALRARLPAVDLTALPWPQAAAKLQVPVARRHESMQEPRVMIGALLLVAATLAALAPDTKRVAARSSGETWGYIGFYVALVMVALALIRRGTRRLRQLEAELAAIPTEHRDA